MGNFARKAIDPAGFFSGQPNWKDALDPGGALIEEATGSSFGRDVADPLKLFKVLDTPEPTKIPAPTTQKTNRIVPGQPQRVFKKEESKRKGYSSTILRRRRNNSNDKSTVYKPTILGGN